MELEPELKGVLLDISSNLDEEGGCINLDQQNLGLKKNGGDYLKSEVGRRLSFENLRAKMKNNGTEARNAEEKLVSGKTKVNDVKHPHRGTKSMAESGSVQKSSQKKLNIEVVILEDSGEEKSCSRLIKSEMNQSDSSTLNGNGCGMSLDKCKRPSMSNKKMPCSNNDVNGEEVLSDKKNKPDEDDEVMVLDPVAAAGIFNRKRKRDSLCQMLSWVTGIAKSPCYTEIGSSAEKLNKPYGNECLKQALLAREAMFLKGRINSSAGQSILQKDQKMHPSMYDDDTGYKERLRCRKSKDMTSQVHASSKSSSGTQSNLDKSGEREKKPSGTSTADSLIDTPIQKRTPLGPGFQAVVPEWTGDISDSDTKWLGARIWPREKKMYQYINERDPIGKGRQDSCGCQFRGSNECVRFHISEKRLRLKLELGPAFQQWKFDQMGEEVRLSWTAQEEAKFKGIVKSNPPSLDKRFWDAIIRSFPSKSREDLVSYYFNVFLLRRRAYQNRATPNDINSDDDDETDPGYEKGKSPMSIFYSPKKKPKVK